MFNDLLLVLPVAGRSDCSVPAPRRGSRLDGNGMLVKFEILDPEFKMSNPAADLHIVSEALMRGSILGWSCVRLRKYIALLFMYHEEYCKEGTVVDTNPAID